jgi:hypothetical protein
MKIDNITEEQAEKLVSEWAYKFGWNVCVITEDDIKVAWKDDTQRDITDEELEAVKTSFYWRKMDDYMIQDAMSALIDAIWEIQNECHE